jgi:hypothetical protein
LSLAVLHTAALLILQFKYGYLSRRHVMLLDAGLIILASATLTWLAGRLTARSAPFLQSKIQDPKSKIASTVHRNLDVLILVAIVLATLPWLLRDIGDGRWYVHDAARWIQSQYPGRSDVRVVTQQSWVPFYARQKQWHILWPDVNSCGPLLDAELLILERQQPPPPEVLEIGDNHQRVRLVPGPEFEDHRGRRGATIYRVEPLR